MTKEVEYNVRELLRDIQRFIMDYRDQEISLDELVLSLEVLVRAYDEKYGKQQLLPEVKV
jgi:hypothetical protein